MFSIENSGLIIFLWIVCAPLVGALLLSFWSPSASLARTRAADRAPHRAPVAGDTTARIAAAENERRDRL